MFFIFPLFLICAVVFTVYLVAITVRDARRVAGRDPSEPEKDIIALRRKFAKQNFVSVTKCCGCDGLFDCECAMPVPPDLYEDPELRRQVNEKKKRLGVGGSV